MGQPHHPPHDVTPRMLAFAEQLQRERHRFQAEPGELLMALANDDYGSPPAVAVSSELRAALRFSLADQPVPAWWSELMPAAGFQVASTKPVGAAAFLGPRVINATITHRSDHDIPQIYYGHPSPPGHVYVIDLGCIAFGVAPATFGKVGARVQFAGSLELFTELDMSISDQAFDFAKDVGGVVGTWTVSALARDDTSYETTVDEPVSTDRLTSGPPLWVPDDAGVQMTAVLETDQDPAEAGAFHYALLTRTE